MKSAQLIITSILQTIALIVIHWEIAQFVHQVHIVRHAILDFTIMGVESVFRAQQIASYAIQQLIVLIVEKATTPLEDNALNATRVASPVIKLTFALIAKLDCF